jgi:hypothetical protein
VRETNNDRYVSAVLANLAGLAVFRGDHQAGQHRAKQSLTIAWELQSQMMTASGLQSVAEAAIAAGETQRGARLFGAGDRAFTMIGITGENKYTPDYKQAQATLTQQLEPAELEALLAEGQAMTLPQAVTYALGEDSPQATGSTSKLSTSP